MSDSSHPHKPLRIALAQTTARDDLQANLRTARQMIRVAADGGAQLIAFPEVFLFVGDRAPKLAAALELDGAVIDELRAQAAQHDLMLLLGSIHERIADDPEHVHNTSVLIDRDGEMLAHYRKMNLFGVDLPGVQLRESDTIAPGTVPPPVVATPLARFGLTVCFDMRFPALYQDLRARGAQVVFVPSNFTVPTGAAHWEVLLRARAIEGQFFVVAPAQVGEHNLRYSSWGHSMVVDPWGQVLMVNNDEVGVRFADLDLAQIASVRQRLPLPNPGPGGDGTP